MFVPATRIKKSQWQRKLSVKNCGSMHITLSNEAGLIAVGTLCQEEKEEVSEKFRIL